MFRRLFAACAWAVLGLTTATADPTPDELIRQYTESLTKAAELLDTVKDAKSATDAKPRLDELATRQAELKATIEKLPARNQRAGRKELDQAEEKLSLAHDRVFAKAKAAYKVLHGSKLCDAVEKPREEVAASQTRLLGMQTKVYAVKNGGGYPNFLANLVDADRPLIEGGPNALNDPWGNTFQYVVETNQQGFPEPFVWTVSPYTGKKLGYPPPEKK